MIMLQANELMIGDWIDFYHPYEPEKKIVTRHRVTEIFECGLVGISDHPNPVHADHIEPIKITSEILKKNGFEKLREGRFLLEDGEDRYWVKFYPKDNNYTCGAYNYIDLDCGCISIREMPIDFVHELQHSMRLCGIEEEIVI